MLATAAALLWLATASTAQGAVDSCTLIPESSANVTLQLRDLLRRCAGRTVVIPPGEFLTAPVNISSHTTLHLREGAVLTASPLKADFPKIPAPPSYGLSRDDRSRPQYTPLRYHPVIFAVNATGVRITGKGVLDGNGAGWMAIRETPALDAGRPRLVELYEVRHAIIEDVTLRNSPFWTIHLLYSDNIHIRGVTINNPKDVDNNDGVDPDSSTNVLIEDCNITVGDDAIAIKSGWDSAGIAYARPTKNITVRNCVFDAENGVSIGSEISGGVEGVYVDNVTMRSFHNALYVKTSGTRGGYVRDVTMSNIRIPECPEAIAVLRNYGDENPLNPEGFAPPATPIGGLRFVNISGRATKRAGELTAVDEAPLTIDFTSVRIETSVGWRCEGPVSGAVASVSPEVCFGGSTLTI